jgi:hypothetical protein
MALASSIRAIMPLQPALLPAVNQENLADLLRGGISETHPSGLSGIFNQTVTKVLILTLHA